MRWLALVVLVCACAVGAWFFFRESGPAPAGPSLVEGRAPVETRFVFEDGGAATGITFAHDADYTSEKYMPETFGSGVAAADFNRDGAPDVLFVDSGPLLPRDGAPPAANRLFLNDGAGRFRDATTEWGLGSYGYGMGLAVGDVDNDGWNDVLLTHYGGDLRLLRNTGGGFEDVTATSGISGEGMVWPTSAAFFDMDGDGDLDLYVADYADYVDPANALRCYTVGLQVYCHPLNFDPLPDRLFENRGDGTFQDVSAARGIVARGRGLALLTTDIDLDGDTDLYVANDLTLNFLWLNDGRGHFTEESRQRGVAFSETGEPGAGMGVDATDIELDGDLDLVCTNFQRQVTTVYRQLPGLTFVEVADRVGVGAPSRRRLGFGVEFFDADNDGDEDLVTANGHIETDIALLTPGESFAQYNNLFENDRGVLREVSAGAGPAFDRERVSRGLVAADLDGDGGLDLVVSNNGGDATVALNRTAGRGRFLVLWLEGKEANRSAIGARALAQIGERALQREVRGGSSYLSVSDFRLHFGLGEATAVDALTIHWPGGKVQELGRLEAGFHRIVEGEAPVPLTPGVPVAP